MLSFEDLLQGKEKICVVGLGYVGLPLACRLARHFKVLGFDKSAQRIEELKQGIDSTGEVDPRDLKNSNLELSYDPKAIKECRLVIVAVPTPVDKLKNPDLSFLKSASELVGKNLRSGSVVVYESTVYPGATEEVCVPILEKESGLRWKEDFFVGYSPERVNPGDKEHTIDKIVKVVSGDTPRTAELLAKVYGAITQVYIAPDIKTAESAKVIENIQRDINIALINELAIIFHKIGVDTQEVLKAAGTKWNFIKFEPGLVGGHCIPVDPYYLAHKALQVGHVPELILAGRSINENMPIYVASQIVKLLIKAGKRLLGSRVLVLGITYKENVPDIRESKVAVLVKELREYGIQVLVHDPIAKKQEVKEEYGIELIEDYEKHTPYDAVVLAVKHQEYVEGLSLERIRGLCNQPPILVDIKWVYDRKQAEEKGFIYWRL